MERFCSTCVFLKGAHNVYVRLWALQCRLMEPKTRQKLCAQLALLNMQLPAGAIRNRSVVGLRGIHLCSACFTGRSSKQQVDSNEFLVKDANLDQQVVLLLQLMLRNC